jgi:hypothetical protein
VGEDTSTWLTAAMAHPVSRASFTVYTRGRA